MRNAFSVEGDYRVIKTLACESHTGNPAPSLTPLLNPVVVRRGEDDDKQPRFQQARFLGFVGGPNEVIALRPYGVQRHHGEWLVSPLDDSESDLREKTTALAQMAKCNWRTPVCKTCQESSTSQGLAFCGVVPESFLQQCPTRCALWRQQRDFWTLVLTMRVWTMNRNVRKVLEHLHSRNHLRSRESSFQTTDVEALRPC